MTRQLEVLGEHTLDVSLLAPGGWVLDAGCRDFIFAGRCAARGCWVLAVDADPAIQNPHIEQVLFKNVGLSAKTELALFNQTSDPQACFLSATPGQWPTVQVPAFGILDLLHSEEIELPLNAIKLDIEGAEYEILREWPGPTAKQISVEFHEHVRPRPQGIYDEIFAHLSRWYDVVQHEKSARHCCAPNYWDTLLVLKGE